MSQRTASLIGPFVIVCLVLFAATAQAQLRQQLRAGDTAPNFTLKTVDGSQEIQLAAFDQPVVLFFGSFT